MARLPQVIIPKNYASLTTRRVHVAEWVDGEKLSQSTADNVGELVNLGVIVYLTQLLDTVRERMRGRGSKDGRLECGLLKRCVCRRASSLTPSTSLTLHTCPRVLMRTLAHIYDLGRAHTLAHRKNRKHAAQIAHTRAPHTRMHHAMHIPSASNCAAAIFLIHK